MARTVRSLTITVFASLLFGVVSPAPPFARAAQGNVVSGDELGVQPAAAEVEGGGFVVVWAVLAEEGSPGAVRGRVLNPEGAPIGPVFSVNTSPILALNGQRLRPAVTPLTGGAFLVVWRYSEDGADGEIFGRRFSSRGTAETAEIRLSGGQEFQVNAESRGDQRGPAALSLEDGSVVVVWESVQPEGSAIVGRLFDEELRPLTADFPISEVVTSGQSPQISPALSGGFEVRWHSLRGPRLRRFDDEAVPRGPAHRAPDALRLSNCNRQIPRQSGDLLRVWQEECDQPSSVVAQLGTTIFADGFESGDTSAWSQRVPGMTLAFLSPSAGACLPTNTPALSLSYVSPTGQGVNLASVVVSASGTSYGASCSATPSTVDCTLIDALPEGNQVIRVDAEDTEGHPAEPATRSFTIDTLPPGPILTGRVTLTPNGAGSVSIAGGPGAAEAEALVTVTNQTTSASTSAVANLDGSFLATLAADAGDVLALTQADCSGQASGESLLTVPTGGQNLPPNPAEVAPPVDPTVPTEFPSSIEFIYTGPDPIQTGVAPGVIEVERVAVLRGRVLSRGGAPLPGVRITCHDHPEFGETLSRADGIFDLAVNGGGKVVVVFEKTGYLTVQRRLDTSRRDFAWAPDVVLVELDPAVTSVTSGAAQMQVAEGTEVTDPQGTRNASLLVPAGTQAHMVLPDGSQQPLASLDVRLTEFTIGAEGPAAMPAPLPSNTGYTYALELSADEAIAAGAVSVEFDQVLVQYVENFLAFPVGGAVPLGYYDREQAAWRASEDGRIVEIVGVDPQGRAELDIDGSGQAADPAALAALGVTDDERIEVASRYPLGMTLWRLPIPHFTPWDCNWPYGPPPDAEEPPDPTERPEDNDPTDDDDEPSRDLKDPCELLGGSFIECENQVLRESLPIVGTPHRLNYNSARVPGRKVKRTLKIPLSRASVPRSVSRIEIDISVAGRRFQQNILPAPNLSYLFTWDGLDAFGRELIGGADAFVETRYVYDAVYYEPGDFDQAFGNFSDTVQVIGVQGRGEIVLTRRATFRLQGRDSHHRVLGGWTLDAHHQYDPESRTLSLGSGRHRGIDAIELGIDTAAGTGISGYSGDGGPATAATMAAPFRVRRGPEGSLYVAEYQNHVVRRIRPDGVVETFAGDGTLGNSGDGGPATQAQLGFPSDVAFAPDESVYIADQGGAIRRVDPNGTITTVFATTPGAPGPFGIAVNQDGQLFMVNAVSAKLFRVEPSGSLAVIGGEGLSGGDGLPAIQTQFHTPVDLEFGPDGVLYVVELGTQCVRSIGADGIVRTIAGGSGAPSGSGDGGPATEAGLGQVYSIAFGEDGSLYIAHEFPSKIRRVHASMISTVVGSGTNGYEGDGGPAAAASMMKPRGVEIDQEGRLVVADFDAHVLRVVAPFLPGFSVSDLAIPSSDGKRIYSMSSEGRHLRTLDALTGSEVWTFEYDPEGRLTGLRDAFDNLATIERDTSGGPLAIVGPYGHRTIFTLDSNGYLASLTTPEGLATSFAYTDSGLLETMTDPRGGIHAYEYSPLGRLVLDGNAAGGFLDPSRKLIPRGHRVEVSTPLDLVTSYEVIEEPAGGRVRRRALPDGFAVETTRNPDGSGTTSHPDGTSVTWTRTGDPRFGLQAPIVDNLSISTPEGRSLTMSHSRSVTLTDPLNPLSLEFVDDIWTVNGRIFRREYDALLREVTLTTPEGRQATVSLDALSRPKVVDPPGAEPMELDYDARGRLNFVRQGSGAAERLIDFEYDLKGRLEWLTDPSTRVLGFIYDEDNRLLSQTLPPNRVIGLTHDDNGNLQTLTPPGRPAHMFGYTADDLGEVYDPPDVGVPDDVTIYEYDEDRRLDLVLLAGPGEIDTVYDPVGRPQDLLYPGGGLSFGYSPTTGRLETISKSDGVDFALSYDGFLLKSTTWAGSVAGGVSRAYTDDFWLDSESVNGTQTILYDFDDDGLLEQVGELDVHRNMGTGVESGSTVGLVTTSTGFDEVFRELEELAVAFDSNELLRIAYPVRDKLGRIVERHETIQGGPSDIYSYGYHPDTGFLESVAKNGTLLASYTYDDNGNRLAYSGPFGTVTTTTYDDQDRLMVYGDTTFTYTPRGTLASRTQDGQTVTYNYDALGDLTAVVLPDGVEIEYLSDGAGRRVGKEVNGSLVKGYLYRDRVNPVAELDAGGGVVSRFVYGTRPNVPDYLVKGGLTYRIFSDQLGSPRLVIDVASGNILQRLDYDEFGRVTLDTNPGFQPFGFAGGLYDQQTGLLRFGARDYDPTVGRWTTKDPIGFRGGDTSLYAYVRNDPINRIDPLGLCPQSPLDRLRDQLEKLFEQTGIPQIKDDLDTALEFLLDHGSLFVAFDVGRGKAGMNLTITLDSEGLAYTLGAGLGIGVGAAAGADLSFGEVTDPNLTLSASGGDVLGGHADWSASPTGQQSLTAGGGLGFGYGATLTTPVYGGTLISFQ